MKKVIFTLSTLSLAACIIFSGCSEADRANLSSATASLVGDAKADVGATASTTLASTQPTVSDGSVSVFFPRAGQDAEGELISTLNTASKKLDVAIYEFTDTKIADAIASAKQRGVTVRLMTDRENAGQSAQKKALGIVKAAGIPVKDNTHSGIMHMKVSIIDSGTVTTGSFNYTKSAQNTNDENLVIIRNATISSQYEAEFNAMWSDTKEYADWNG